MNLLAYLEIGAIIGVSLIGGYGLWKLDAKIAYKQAEKEYLKKQKEVFKEMNKKKRIWA